MNARQHARPPVPLIGFGQVHHARLRPVRHAFVYPTYFLLLPMRQLRAGTSSLALNRWAPLSFHDADHGDGRGPAEGGALAWLEQSLREQGITDADGDIWLHTYPRVWGYTFKPVSFWYCHRADGTLRAVLAEVNNTFGERHCYLLDAPPCGEEVQAQKVFHVSPFCRVEGRYRFRFQGTHQRDARQHTAVSVDHDDDQGPLLTTRVSGELCELTPATMRRALWAYPAMTLMVMARIHWQAWQLWRKRTGFFRKPPPPTEFLTR